MRAPLIAITLLSSLHANPLCADPPTREQIRTAADKSIVLLQKAAMKYTDHRQCFSCHHQALPTFAFLTAKAHGFKVDDKVIEHQLKHTADFLAKNRENYKKGKGQGGQVDTAGYAMFLLAAGGWKADETTDAVIEYLLQRDKDHWVPVSKRPPTEASPFTTTYLALAALKHYGPEAKKDAIDGRSAKARKWLLATQANDTEDLVFRLRALHEVGATKTEMQKAVDALERIQNADGGWSQLDGPRTPESGSDAYATGSVLAALHQAGGLDVKSRIYERGINYLIATQKADGSWYVKSRSKPFQLYFESGFPHTKDQWISCAASSWATVALVLGTREPDRRDPLRGPPSVKYHDTPLDNAEFLAKVLTKAWRTSRPEGRVASVNPAKLFVFGDLEAQREAVVVEYVLRPFFVAQPRKESP